MRISDISDIKLAVIGLGYVGLPLAAEFAKLRPVIGFDIDERRVSELSVNFDRTGELDRSELLAAEQLTLTTAPSDLKNCNCYIITVPTPVDSQKRPNLSALLAASEIVGSVLSCDDIVIYESTVYPGATEEDCAPVLERKSGLFYASNNLSGNDVFHLGYSPERINPGDKKNRIRDIVKVTSGSSVEVADLVDKLYASIVSAGTHRTGSIRIAEAAKVIENTQRDVNIALINELTMIFDQLGIDTEAVLKAAGTKWNFLQFWPGLVGGHCIGVDPYYLTHKAQQVGYNPEIILAGRNLNDSMSGYVATRLTRAMMDKGLKIIGARVLVLGLTFKENCPDTRNSKVCDLIQHLADLGCEVDVTDPMVALGAVPEGLAGRFVKKPLQGFYDAMLVAVGHTEFSSMGAQEIRSFGTDKAILFDLKYLFSRADVDFRI